MALPISVLFASIMTMGNFGEKYELVAMKAGGISLRRVMMPMTFVALLLTGVGFYFANNVMPAAMLKYRTILYDVTRKKPAINIRPSEYYTEIDGYVIRVDGKDADGMTLRDVTIFDNTKGSGQSNIIVARSGRMQTSADERYMIFTLYDGCYYSEAMEGNSYLSRPLTRVNFAEEVMTFDISSFAFNKSDDESFQGTYQMMNVSQLDEAASGLEKYRDGLYDEFGRQVDMRLKGLTDGRTLTAPTDGVGDQRWLPAKGIASAYINRHYIELHRKFTLSVACLLLFLVGAPFGSIVRKGGLGLPLVASVGFFVFYYVIGMICEKAVRESAMSPVGMWVSSLVMLPIGIFLTLQATTDRDLALGQWFGLAGERLKVRWRLLRMRLRRHHA